MISSDSDFQKVPKSTVGTAVFSEETFIDVNKPISEDQASDTKLVTYSFLETVNLFSRVAKLANLSLSEKELEVYSQQLSKILEYIVQLRQLDAIGTEPTFNVTGSSNVMWGDESSESLTQEEALQNIPTKKDGFFVTKGVFEGS